MGTIIEATATAEGGSLGALGLADAAARLCLERAKRTAEEVDLLIDAGVYNDKGISEPAVASLIQEDIGANLEQQPGAGQGTFSFDVHNGGCGMLSGIQLVDGMLASKTITLGLVVASDIDPDPGVSKGFGFPAVGGAVLLSADDSRAGFTAFRCATFPEFAGLFQSDVDWRDDIGLGRSDQGRNVLTHQDVGDAVGFGQCQPQPVRLGREDTAPHRELVADLPIQRSPLHPARTIGQPREGVRIAGAQRFVTVTFPAV